MICNDKNGNPVDIGMFVKYEKIGKPTIYGIIENVGRKPKTIGILPCDYSSYREIPFESFERIMPNIYNNSECPKIYAGINHYILKNIPVLEQGKQHWDELAASYLLKDGNNGLFFITTNYIGIAYSRSMRNSVELEVADDFMDFSLPQNWYDVKDFEVQDVVSIYCFGDSDEIGEGKNGWHHYKTFGFDPKLLNSSQRARNLIPKLFKLALKGTKSFEKDILPILGQYSSVCVDGSPDELNSDDPIREIIPYDYGNIGNGYEPSNDEILDEMEIEDSDEYDEEAELAEAIKKEKEEEEQIYDSFKDYDGYIDGMNRYANKNPAKYDRKPSKFERISDFDYDFDENY